MLKGRFQSLQELHLKIQKPDNLTYVMHWIQCCIVLHNMIVHFKTMLGFKTSMYWAWEQMTDAKNGLDHPAVVVPDGTPGQHFRVDLMQELFTALSMNFQVNEGED